MITCSDCNEFWKECPYCKLSVKVNRVFNPKQYKMTLVRVKRKSISKNTREKVYKKDNYKCAKCKTSENLTIDHIKPLCHGGKDEFDNYQTLCRKCNHDKSAKEINYRNK